MSDQPKPSVGRIVHYVSHGTPVREDGTQAYAPQCRAAIVTDLSYSDPELTDPTYEVGLCVLNPTGMFFNENVKADFTEHQGGTWHWPERV
jgi:hypothetical protein